VTRVGVVTFPGTLDDRDAARAVRLAGGEPVRLWHKDPDLHGVRAVVLPGGFSYGDYLRCGAIAAVAPVMRAVVEEARRGLPVLGICNGFQVLCEAHLLEGALVRNSGQRFVCRDQTLLVENADTAWTRDLEAGTTLTIPLKHGEGSFQALPEDLARLEDEGRVVFRYTEGNPNGSAHDIAGIANRSGTVVGLMPHPEHAVEAGFGPRSGSAGEGVAAHGGTDGLALFASVLRALVG
jgi:phosphoribosylformylglycinamidine synthase